MNIETDAYSAKAIDTTSTVILKGTLRLQGREQYQPVSDMLMRIASTAKEGLTIDMRDLIFLNSSGISALSLFIIEMRKIEKPVSIVGSSSVSWQTKSLMNFHRLYEQVEIRIE